MQLVIPSLTDSSIRRNKKEEVMARPQVAIRLPPHLMDKLNSYVARTGVSKTEVLVGALAQYLNSPESIPLGQRVTEVERKMEELERMMKAK